MSDKSIKSLLTGKKATKKVASASKEHGGTTAPKLSTVTTPTTKSVEKVPHSVLNMQNQLRLILHPTNARPGDRITVSQELLDSIPSSKYSRTTWQGNCSKTNINTQNDGNSSDATIPYSDPDFDKVKTCLKHRRKHQQTAKSNKSFKFKVKVHGI